MISLLKYLKDFFVVRAVTPVASAALPPPPRLGEVVASMLDATQFAQVNGSGWVLADGRAVPDTLYAKMVSSNVPDLRGVYLRGMNYGRDRSSGNPDGDLPLGSYQPDQVVRHAHSTIQMIGDNNVDGVDSTTTRSGDHHNEARLTGEFGGSETRPRTVIVNFYIRVDGYPVG